MPKLTEEEIAKRAVRIKLVVDGWNGGLTAGEISRTHGITRNAVIGILHRARAAGVVVEVRRLGSRGGEIGRKKVSDVNGRPSQLPDTRRRKPKPGMPVLEVPPLRLTTRPEGNWQKRRPPPKLSVVPLPVLAGPSDGLWVGFMELEDRKGCRYSEDGAKFCNRHGFPYCSDHRAITHPPAAQLQYGGKKASRPPRYT